jgi:DNA-binding transcriptional LysR family regulator
LEAFQVEYPDIDLRIDTSDTAVDMDTSDMDIAFRYARPGTVPAGAARLFGEQLTVVASPWLLKTVKQPYPCEDLARFAFVEAGDTHRTQHLELPTWRRWLKTYGLQTLEPKRWLYFNSSHQIVQTALTGQGVVLARMPLIADSLAWRPGGDSSHHAPGLALGVLANRGTSLRCKT